MSTQIHKKDCINWQTYRPYLVPSFIGNFTPVESAHPDRCYNTKYSFNDPPRRYDERILQNEKRTYGKYTPKLNSYVTDVVGIGKGESSMYETFYTAEGAVKLPRNFQDIPRNTFIPNTSDISFVQNRDDTRLLGKPSRYYRQ